MRIRAYVTLCGAVFLSGCQNPPLMFASGETFGVNIAINGTSTNPIDLVLGYKSLNATLVPVTQNGAGTSAIRGCNNSASGSKQMSACSGADGSSAKDAAAKPTSARAADSAWLQPAAFGLTPDIEGKFGSQTNSTIDALSVYSSFNADAKAQGGTGPSASVGFGTVFATGVAAQNLAEGQRMAATYEAISSNTCLQELAAVLKASGQANSVTAPMVQVCARPSTPPDPAQVQQQSGAPKQ